MMLSPYFPLAMLVATLVALLRGLLSDAKGKTKLDGKAVVLPIVAVLAVAVCAWSQLRLDAPSVLDWRKIGVDAPIVFVLAAGGATFLQRLKDRGLLALTGEVAVAELKESPPAVGTISAADFAAMLAAMPGMTSKSHTTITGTVEVKAVEPQAATPVVPPAPEVPSAPPVG